MWDRKSRPRRSAYSNSLILLVRPGGLEPPTKSLGNSCSFHLSYGRTSIIISAGLLRPGRLAGRVSSG